MAETDRIRCVLVVSRQGLGLGVLVADPLRMDGGVDIDGCTDDDVDDEGCTAVVIVLPGTVESDDKPLRVRDKCWD